MLQVPNSRTRMLQVGDRVLNYRADEEGIVSRVEGTNVVVDAADGWRWRLQSARNFFLLDDAETIKTGSCDLE